MKIKTITYDIGGFDPSKLNDNILETIYYTDEELGQQAQVESAKAAATAKLAALGLTTDDLKALGLGNN
jgi:hypothetical protein